MHPLSGVLSNNVGSQSRATSGYIGIDRAQFLEPFPLAGPLHAVEGHLKDIPQIGLRPNWFLQDTKELVSCLQKKRRAPVILHL